MKCKMIVARNQDAICRRCGSGFKLLDKVWVAGKSNALKYYCEDCERVIHIEVK